MDRQRRLESLRSRLREASTANRRDMAADRHMERSAAKNQQRLERKRRLAAQLADKDAARRDGESVEQRHVWEYSIQDSERWAEKKAAHEELVQEGFTGHTDAARRRYFRDMARFKPDLAAYEEQVAHNDAAYPGPGAAAPAHTPSEAARRRLEASLDADARRAPSRARADGKASTHINEPNKRFNKKLDRFYDDSTRDIRDNLARGTAL